MDADALVLPDTRWSYRELVDRAFVAGSALRAAGLRYGDRIGLLMDTSPEFVELLAGAALIGIVAVLFNPDVSADELAAHLTKLDVEIIFASQPKRRDLLGAIIAALPPLISSSEHQGTERASRARRFITVGNNPSAFFDHYTTFIAAGSRRDSSIAVAAANITAASTLAIVFTSGATGTPAACAISHLNVLCKTEAFVQTLGLNRYSRLWSPLPMFQTGFLIAFLLTITAGAALVTSARFEAAESSTLITQERVTHAFPIYATYWLPIIYRPEFRPSDHSELTRICLLGPADMLRRAQLALPHCVITNIYGTVESAGVCCMSNADDPQSLRLATAGTPLPGIELRVVDPLTGALRKSNEIGEVQMRGIGVIDGYFADPQRTAQYFDADGWFRTGDLGSLNERNMLRYCGRLSDMLTIDGESIPATILENSLCSHPAVAVAQVLGRADPAHGEISVAFIQIRRGAMLGANDVIEFCRGQMKESHIPRYIAFVDEWPISASRIRKQVLAELAVGPRLLK
jgi:fatty-acyl-CoA synthase